MPFIVQYTPAAPVVNAALGAGQFAAGRDNFQASLGLSRLDMEQQHYQDQLGLQRQQLEAMNQYRLANLGALTGYRRAVIDARNGATGERYYRDDQTADYRDGRLGIDQQRANQQGTYQQGRLDQGGQRLDQQGTYQEARLDQGQARMDQQANQFDRRQQYLDARPTPDYQRDADQRDAKMQYQATMQSWQAAAQAKKAMVLSKQNQINQQLAIIRAVPGGPEADAAMANVHQLEASMRDAQADYQRHVANPPPVPQLGTPAARSPAPTPPTTRPAGGGEDDDAAAGGAAYAPDDDYGGGGSAAAAAAAPPVELIARQHVAWMKARGYAPDHIRQHLLDNFGDYFAPAEAGQQA